ncbi:MAG: hypothetical protein H6705_00295 [Myxococcales bacterium]|nr:hypothetical protein [Myxococcales bacterium]
MTGRLIGLLGLFALSGCVADGGGGDDDDMMLQPRDAAAVVPDLEPPDSTAQIMPTDCTPTGAEVCNGEDDDCNGNVDEGFGVGGPCTVGIGACAATGSWVCGEGGGTTCDAVKGAPGEESCNAEDDDCDGETDEGYDVGEPCSVQVQACVARGVMACTADGTGTGCAAPAIEPQDELCNEADDDCDGQIDEGIVIGERCEVGVGLCRRGGLTDCDPDGQVTCRAAPGPERPEECNGFDDDCDGIPDEDFGAQPCSDGVGACRREGFSVCTGEGELTCNVRAGEPTGEVCNNIDDDCDGTVDEGYADRLGQPCSVGVGACARESVWACDPEGGGGILFEGIRQNVEIAELEEAGFERCWAGGFARNEGLDGILAACDDGVLLLGCMPAGSDTLTLAAMGERDEVLTDTGRDQDAVHNHNGVDWYYSPEWSWGFAPAGAGVSRNSCDTDDAQGELRMCWHTGGNQIQNGYRCGNNYPGDDFTRVIYHRPAGPGLLCDVAAGEPAAQDACNGADDDCDGATDEDTPGLGEPCDGIELGLCEGAFIGCTPEGEIACVPRPLPPEREFCNQRDDDCDGATDEDFAGIGEACTVGEGICARDGILQCEDLGGRAGGGLDFEGIRQDVPEAELLGDGFEVCWRGLYGEDRPALAQILEQCGEDVLLLGCRRVGAPNLQLAATGERAEVLTDVGPGQNAVHNHNGVDWYFNGQSSWGFAAQGTGVSRNSCDTGNVQPELRMCWHTGGNNINNGYRCGNNFLNGDNGWERIIYQRPGGPGAVCSVEPGEPLEAELCNGDDDDCDGTSDEEVEGVGGDCYEGVGACERGVGSCGPDGFVCEAVPIEVPSDEVCNGFDDDCNGEIDDLPGRGEPCEVGVGACVRPGVIDCSPDRGVRLVEGVQNNVEIADIERMGFRECFRGDYNGFDPIGPLLDRCPGEVMMLGCREGGAGPLRVAAMAMREDVIFNTGNGNAAVHEANGVAWYFSDQWSWGFAPAGAPVNRNSCDVEGLDPNDPTAEQRLCWHTGGGNLNGGWRCGANTGAAGQTERFVFVADRLGGDLECVGEPGEPAAVDACNGQDDDCDGVTDEDTPGLGAPCDGAVLGPCQGGRIGCTAEGEITCVAVDLEPGREFCNGEDDDCDGAIDEDYPNLGEACVAGEGICARDGVVQCEAAAGGIGGGLQFAGIRQDVPEAEVIDGGFEPCWRGFYGDNQPPVAQVLEGCDEGVLLLGCRRVGAPNLQLAAMGARAEVLTDVGQDQAAVHNHNGVDWYFNDSYSWGFAAEGTGVIRNSCDVGEVQGELRMCWHTGGGNLNNGYRCGNDFAFDNNWERVIYHRPDGPGAVCSAEPGPALDGELCNGDDDDCDGATDEGMEGVGDDCFDGVGACERGVGICDADGLTCQPVPIEVPSDEICNGFDDDCNGEVDDLPGRGDVCEVGVGECARPGVLACPADGGVRLVEGVQNDVAIADLERIGFRECFRGRYDGGEPIRPILDGCPGEVLLLGCREIGSEPLRVAAMALREDVIFDTGQGQNAVHEANGVAWYFSDNYSWGFAPGGARVSRNSCDTEDSAPGTPTAEQRICWHTGGGNLDGGWRCGANTGAWNQTERFVFVAERLGGGLECSGAAGLPAAEVCNGLDDDCDGSSDEGLACP